MKVLTQLALESALLAALLGAATTSWTGTGKPRGTQTLTREHVHPSGAFSFRTPEAWNEDRSQANPDRFDVAGDGVLVRFLYRGSEVGYDSLHVDCMLERLSGPMEAQPHVRYEYDFLSWTFGGRRALDSAFVVRYDKPIRGSREWRQRNLTVVGPGQSLCVIAYVPAAVWKRSPGTRTLLDSVLGSVTFR